MDQHSSIFVAGHTGLVGSAVVRELKAAGYTRILCVNRSELNLLDQGAVQRFFRERPIDHVFLCAARVGGIFANSAYPADFLYENLMMAANIIAAAAENGIEKLLFLGSSCIYPRLAPQPIAESSLLSGPLEPTNEGYALAKIVGLKLCEMYRRQYGKNFISTMPTNLYGMGDNFHPENSHVIPGMMRRFHEAKLQDLPFVEIWGTGEPRREFLHVNDLASALLLLMEKYESAETINIGTGEDCKIAELAELMKSVTGFRGEIRYDRSKPDGTPRKVLDVRKIRALGWKPKISLEEGLRATYLWALEKGKLERSELSAQPKPTDLAQGSERPLFQ